MTFTRWEDYKPDERTALEKIPGWRLGVYMAALYVALCALMAVAS